MQGLKLFIKEHKEFGRQLLELAKADLLKTYRGASLGWLWAIVKPSITIFVYFFAFSVGIRSAAQPVIGGDGKEYEFFLWLIGGIIPWFYVSEMMTQGTDCIKKYSYLVTKMRFPVSTIPTFVSISKMLINMCLTLAIMVIFCFYGHFPSIYYLQLIYYMLCQFLFFTAFSLFNSTLSVISKDYGNLIKSLTTAVFWLSGIMWNISSVKNDTIRGLLRLNPVTYICSGYRDCYIYNKWFWDESNYQSTLAFFGVLLAMWAFSLYMYNKTRKDLPDVL